MPSNCVWCGRRGYAAEGPLVPRREESCLADPPSQGTGGLKRKGVWVCTRFECTSKMLPEARTGFVQEWLKFHVTRKAVTTLRNSGRSTSASLAYLQFAHEFVVEEKIDLSAVILKGLTNCCNSPSGRRIYDPEFDDPALHMAVCNIWLAMGSPPMFWYFVWCILVRFNSDFNGQLFRMWGSDSKTVFEKALDGVVARYTSAHR